MPIASDASYCVESSLNIDAMKREKIVLVILITLYGILRSGSSTIIKTASVYVMICKQQKRWGRQISRSQKMNIEVEVSTIVTHRQCNTIISISKSSGP